MAKFQKDEFLCLFMIYSSHVDYDYTEDEKHAIIELFGFELAQKMETYFLEHSEGEIFKQILSALDTHVATAADKKELASKLQILFRADGKYCNFEKSFMNFLDLHFEGIF